MLIATSELPWPQLILCTERSTVSMEPMFYTRFPYQGLVGKFCLKEQVGKPTCCCFG